MKLSPIQEKIVETPGDLIVRASAGTGKTHTMVNKIAKEIDDNHTHKVIAAITFCIKLDMNFDYLFRSSYMPV